MYCNWIALPEIQFYFKSNPFEENRLNEYPFEKNRIKLRKYAQLMYTRIFKNIDNIDMEN